MYELLWRGVARPMAEVQTQRAPSSIDRYYAVFGTARIDFDGQVHRGGWPVAFGLFALGLAQLFQSAQGFAAYGAQSIAGFQRQIRVG